MRTARWLAPADTVQAVDRAAEALRREITEGGLAPGVELTAHGIGEREAVSLEVAEAALARLESVGSVVRRGGSLIVPPLDRTEFRRLYQVRRVLEPELVAQGSQLFSMRALDELHNATETMIDRELPAPIRMTARLRVRAMRFGPLVGGGWEYRTLYMVRQALERYTRLTARVTTGVDEEYLTLTVAELRGMVTACRARDGAAARAGHLVLVDTAELVEGLALDHFDHSPRSFAVGGPKAADDDVGA